MNNSNVLAADDLVLVELAGEDDEIGFNDSTSKPQHKMQSALFLDVVVCKRAAVLQLLACKDQSLLVGWDALLVLNLGLDILDGIAALHLEGDCFACVCVVCSTA